MIRLFYKEHLFFTFGYIAADKAIDMPAVIPPLAVRVYISVVVDYPSVPVFPENKRRLIERVSVIIDRIYVIKRLIIAYIISQQR